MIDILIHISSYSSYWNSHSLQHCYKNHFLLKTNSEGGHTGTGPDASRTLIFFHVGDSISIPCSKPCQNQDQTPTGSMGHCWCFKIQLTFQVKQSRYQCEKWKMKQRKTDRHIKSTWDFQARFLLFQVFFPVLHVPEKSKWNNSLLTE